MISAIIISDGGAFAKMIDIELSLLGISVRHGDGATDLGGAELIVCDLDYCVRTDCSVPVGDFVIGYYEKDGSDRCSAARNCAEILRRPFLTSSFRSVVSQRFSLDEKVSFFSVSDAYGGSEARERSGARDGLKLDTDRCAAVYGDRSILLSALEYKTLARLLGSRGEVVLREELSSLLGGDGNMPEVYICHLRKKIDDAIGVKTIYTVRGKGYMIKDKIR